jgi:hypothetical protein
MWRGQLERQQQAVRGWHWLYIGNEWPASESLEGDELSADLKDAARSKSSIALRHNPVTGYQPSAYIERTEPADVMQAFPTEFSILSIDDCNSNRRLEPRTQIRI